MNEGQSPKRTSTFTVTLPNGRPCEVTYTRYQARNQQFRFGSPLNQSRHVSSLIENTEEAIEREANALVVSVFEYAQQEERRAMQRKTASSQRTSKKQEEAAFMTPKAAERLGGRYAVCLKGRSGNLICLGPTHEEPETAYEELRSGRHASLRLFSGQEIVIGICNRAERRWQEPEFLVESTSLQEDRPPSNSSLIEETPKPKTRRTASKPRVTSTSTEGKTPSETTT